MIQKPDAAVAHPNAVVINTHDAAIATHTAMFRSWGHNLAAGFAPGEFTYLGNLSGVVHNLLLFCGGHFQKFDIIFVLSNHKL